MNYYAGIDVSLEASCICVVDANGKVVREGKVSSEPTPLIALQKEPLETESSLRGILRGFGLKVGKTTPVGFEGRIRELVAGHPWLSEVGVTFMRIGLEA